MRSDFADGAGVLEIFAHELLGRQQPSHGRIVPQRGEPELIGAVEDVFGFAVLKMQIVADPQQKIAGGAKRALLRLGQITALGQGVEIDFTVANKSNPAYEL